MTQQMIDVPYYRQIDLNSGLNSYWQNRSCGILSLKMVIDFFRAKDGNPPVDLENIFSGAIANGGTDARGHWYHSAFVKTAIEHGFVSWRKSWRPAERDKDHFRGEGVDEESIKRWEEQTKSEAIPTLINQLKKGYPVILSVDKNFNEIDSAHAVVLTGVNERRNKVDGFYFNDPYALPNRSGKKNLYISYNKLINNWYWRAIFVEPRGK